MGAYKGPRRVGSRSLALFVLGASVVGTAFYFGLGWPNHGTAAALPARAVGHGTAVALPSIPATATESASIVRGQYGGKGDKAHLGGFTSKRLDGMGISPEAWTMMTQKWVVKSVVDVGCGIGISSSWFHIHGLKTLCVEGSHDAVEQSLLPKELIVEHDFTRGPWWPAETYDLAWSVEFLEHVGQPYMQNYMPIFRKSAVIVVSHSTWGGWHHVEVHDDAWWRRKFELLGFVYSKTMTDELKAAAKLTKHNRQTLADEDERKYSAQHLWLTGMVFINPSVASLPKHAHLLAEDGCFRSGAGNGTDRVPCTGADALPQRFLPIRIDQEMEAKWEHMIHAGRAGGSQTQAQA